jgi:hypothetical protein
MELSVLALGGSLDNYREIIIDWRFRLWLLSWIVLSGQQVLRLLTFYLPLVDISSFNYPQERVVIKYDGLI